MKNLDSTTDSILLNDFYFVIYSGGSRISIKGFGKKRVVLRFEV